jgi:hypothetical protein
MCYVHSKGKELFYLQVGGPRFSDCPRLLIRYIRRYPLYMEAVSSIRKLRTRHTVVTKDLTGNSSARFLYVVHALLTLDLTASTEWVWSAGSGCFLNRDNIFLKMLLSRNSWRPELGRLTPILHSKARNDH